MIIQKIINKIKKRILVQNIYKLDDPQLIVNLRKVNSKYKIEIVDEKYIGILKEYTEKFRKKKYFENSLLPALNDKHKIGLLVIDSLNNKLAYICWVYLKHERSIYDAHRIKLKSDEALIEDAYCIPEYRNQGLHHRMMQERLNQCVKNKKKRTYIAIYNFNYKAINNIKKFEFELYKKHYRIRLFKRMEINFILPVIKVY